MQVGMPRSRASSTAASLAALLLALTALTGCSTAKEVAKTADQVQRPEVYPKDMSQGAPTISLIVRGDGDVEVAVPANAPSDIVKVDHRIVKVTGDEDDVCTAAVQVFVNNLTKQWYVLRLQSKNESDENPDYEIGPGEQTVSTAAHFKTANLRHPDGEGSPHRGRRNGRLQADRQAGHVRVHPTRQRQLHRPVEEYTIMRVSRLARILTSAVLAASGVAAASCSSGSDDNSTITFVITEQGQPTSKPATQEVKLTLAPGPDVTVYPKPGNVVSIDPTRPCVGSATIVLKNQSGQQRGISLDNGKIVQGAVAKANTSETKTIKLQPGTYEVIALSYAKDAEGREIQEENRRDELKVVVTGKNSPEGCKS